MLKAKQVEKILSASVRVVNFTASGASTNCTTAITSALNAAGNGGVAVPLQVSPNVNTLGVIVANPANFIEIYGNSSKQRLQHSGDEIYAKLTETGGVYTLTYYTSNDAGVESAYTFAAPTAIDFKFNYRFDFARYPADAVPATSVTIVDPVSGAGVNVPLWMGEKLTVTAQNVLSNISKNPSSSTDIYLIVNTAKHNAFGGASADFTVANKVITWSVANTGYNLDTTDDVIAFYRTNE